MATLRFKQVDVFTRRPFWGNPVAVVIGAESLQTEDMQRIAGWTNLSETTFVLPPSSDRADYRLRIFSPRQELPFAGHPTIGSAHTVIESGFAAAGAGRLRQECLAGILPLTVEENHDGNLIMVEAPPAQVAEIDDSSAKLLSHILEAGISETIPPARIDVGVVWIVANVADASTLARLKPDLAALARLSAALEASGVTIFGAADDQRSALHVRSFAPLQGIAEDPVCGSGNAGVAAYLRHNGLLDTYGSEYTARQGMQVGRDGEVRVRIGGGSIQIGGYAVTCVDGVLHAPRGLEDPARS
jgi:PhzF family phenazine biosynthesis protein